MIEKFIETTKGGSYKKGIKILLGQNFYSYLKSIVKQ